MAMNAVQDKLDVWEASWAKYDEATYRDVLAQICDKDIVFEIGAGDLRLAIRMAGIARIVHAVEIQKPLLEQIIYSSVALPANLFIHCRDARSMPVPSGTTVGVLLMRHCTHFQLYAQKLKEAGVQALITNARWKLGVERIPLQEKRLPFDGFEMGWYACWCGAVGFKPGPAEQLTPEREAGCCELGYCPQCSNPGGDATRSPGNNLRGL
jgi:hypothetical protein